MVVDTSFDHFKQSQGIFIRGFEFSRKQKPSLFCQAQFFQKFIASKVRMFNVRVVLRTCSLSLGEIAFCDVLALVANRGIRYQ